MRKYWKFIALATFLLLIIIINFSGYFSFINLHIISTNYLRIVSFIESNYFLANFFYILLYIFAVLLVMPGAWLLTFSGGFFFGWMMGSILTVIGATVGASILFILSKSIFGKLLTKRITKNKGLLNKFESKIEKNEFYFLLFMRLMPLFPFVFVNIAPAIVGVRFRTYVITTFIGIIPATIIYSLLGSGASEAFITGNLLHIKDLISFKIILGLTGLSFLALIPVLLKYKYFNLIK